MKRLKLAKMCFVIAALLFVAKPFVGFCVYSSLNPASSQNILVKSFTKRTLEYSRKSNISTIQKKLSEIAESHVLLFNCLLCTIFPVVIIGGRNITSSFLHSIQLGLAQKPNTYLLNRQFII